MISCVERKLIFGSQIDDEVNAVNKAFENKQILAGFYSNGKITLFSAGGDGQLNNYPIL